MPKIVEADVRRSEIADAAVRAIAKFGFEGATARVVAREGGWSTGTLAHYFGSHDDVLRAASGVLAGRLRERYATAPTASTGWEAIESLGRLLIPSTPTQRDEWKVWAALSARASVDVGLSAELRGAYRVWYGLLTDLVERGRLDGTIDATIDAGMLAVELLALVDGLSIAATIGATKPNGFPSRFLEALRPRPVRKERERHGR